MIIRANKRNSLWDFDVFNTSELAFWMSLSSTATRTSTISYGTNVSGIADVSGNARNLSQSTGTAQPQYQATGFNGLPAIYFDGGDDSLQTSANFPITGNPNFTVIALYRNDTGGFRSLLGWGDGTVSLALSGTYDDGSLASYAYAGGNSFFFASQPAATGLIYAYTKPAGIISGSNLFVNGSSITPSSASTNTPNIASRPLVIGKLANLAFFFRGLLMELIIFNKVLSTDERQRAEGILAHRWYRLAGQSVTLPSNHPYFSTPPTR